GPLAAPQPGFALLGPLAPSLRGVFLFGEPIRTGAAALAGGALALAVVIAGAVALSRSSLIAGEDAPAAGQHQPASSGAASSSPATRPPAPSPDIAIRADRTRPAPAAARVGPPGPSRGNQDLDPVRAAA